MRTRTQLVKGLIFFIVVLHPFLVVYYFYLLRKDAIHIAVVGDLGSERSSLKALEFSVEEINRKGGLSGKEIVLDLYDDRNEPELAEKRALEIVADNQAVAVVGHDCDQCTIAGGHVYRDHRIPAVSPATLNNSAVNGNDWYFRTVFNNRAQGEFLAHYVDNVFEPRSVFIVYENTAYGTDLTGHFEKAMDRIKIPVKTKWGF
ncbi:MAG: ABC transporter substrate-binding protein, partial [Proteobacteria bacterium]|nr:ABC transporter substrate-binding protein [Pseudomonadota bacterium]